jgi:outer membrane protein OmpA-like peptidoglycan-associated protein
MRPARRWVDPTTIRTALLVIAVASLGVALAAKAYASTPSLQYKVKNRVQAGETPELILRATGGDVASGTVRLERDDGGLQTESLGEIAAGSTKRILIDQSSGTHTYDISIDAKGAEGSKIETSMQVKVTVAEKLEVAVLSDEARVAEGKLRLQANRPVDRVNLVVKTADGVTAVETSIDVGGQQGQFQIEWPAEKDVAAIDLKVYDVDGFWRSLRLEPFWVKIPHKEVRFNFGEATWDDDEVSKLEQSLEDIRSAMDKHGDKGLEMQLYIAGYTDTVGSSASNRKLSRRRAKAIGEWFQGQGLDVPIYYQGFGESALAVETPDETKNKKNRRAVYILGNARPPESETIPDSNWRPL